MKPDNIEQLLIKYQRGTATPEEIAFLENWYVQYQEMGEAYDVEALLEDSALVKNQLTKYVRRQQRKPVKWLAAAAILVSILTAGLYLYLNQSKLINQGYNAADIRPGGNRATLTLADGTTLDLREDQTGITMAGDSIAYSNGSRFVDVGQWKDENVLLTLKTPKGGQYQVVLPDGTRVWLNAASTLKYPLHFTDGERRVELEGEAYFEVAKNAKRSFIVQSDGQEVQVLSTHFNINAYADEKNIKTTLLEGVVQVSVTKRWSSNKNGKLNVITPPTLLAPGQQSILTESGSMTVKNVHPEDFVGWKNNLFIFHHTPLKAIMRQISRWYNVDVDMEAIPDVQYYAEIARNVTLDQVLNMLEESSELKFNIEKTETGRRITMKN